MSGTAPRQPREAGFTLLEVLVALTVFGFVMLGLTQGLRFGLLSWDRQARETLRLEELGATERVLRQLVTEADPGRAGEAATFHGAPGALLLRTAMPDPISASGRRVAEAAIGVDGERRLVLRWRPVAAGGERVGEQRVLLAGLDRLELSYWPDATDGARWQRDWNARELPALVRIRLVFADAALRWPDIIAAPMRQRLEDQ